MNDREHQDEARLPENGELSWLLSALCDEVITREEMARLDDLLVRNAECRRAYREMIGLHVALQFNYQRPQAETSPTTVAEDSQPIAQSATQPLPQGLRSVLRGRRFWIVAAVALSAAVLLAAPAMRRGAHVPSAKNQPENVAGDNLATGNLATGNLATGNLATGNLATGNLATGNPATGKPAKGVSARVGKAGDVQATRGAIAQLQFGDDCRWASGSSKYTSGIELCAGEPIDLLAGVARIHCLNGICLVLEGPARLTLKSQTSARLDRGKCFTSVPPPNTGFRLSTPNAEVIDQGTEFGVMVSDSGVSEIGVFKGKVECFAIDRAGECVDRVPLRAGEATRVDGSAAQPLAGLNALKYTFARDAKSPPGVRAYWRFEEEPPAPSDDGLAVQIGAISDSSGNGVRLDYWPGGKSGIGPYRFSNDVPPARMFREGHGVGRHSFDCGALNADATGVAISAGNHGSAEAIAHGFTVEGFFKTHGDRSRDRPMTILYQGEKFYSYLIGVNKNINKDKDVRGAFSFFAFGTGKGGRTSMPEVALTGKNFADGTWHYFAARFESEGPAGRSRLAADVMDEQGRHFSGSTETVEGFKIACSARPLLIGRQQYYVQQKPKAHFDGLIDELRISSRPLRDEELLARLSSEL